MNNKTAAVVDVSTVHQALQKCGHILQQAGLQYVLVAKEAGTFQATTISNIDRRDAGYFLREAADTIETARSGLVGAS